MNISVVLCTYNRCEHLAVTLASLAGQVLPESTTWEILVIDNNSDDNTRDVILEFCRHYPERFRYIFEGQQGKSHALNSGIAQSAGDIVAFTDDDVIAEPTWLVNLTAPLHGGEWGGVGGRTFPEQAFQPPCWLSPQEPYELAPLAIFDLGQVAGMLSESPFGNNMAFPKRVFLKYGGFRTDLGPRPGSQIRSEDTEFGKRLLSAGERLRYEPSAVIRHCVPQSRVQKSYFLSWWYAKARAEVREGAIPKARWHILGIPLSSFRRLVAWTLRWVLAGNPSHRFTCKIKMWRKMGEIMEYYNLSKTQVTRSTIAGCSTSRRTL